MMKSSGNGTPEQCVANLISLYQYEVPYARLKGMPTDVVDKSTNEARSKIKNHVDWLIRTYEPRVTVNSIDTSFDDNGLITVTPDITVNEV